MAFLAVPELVCWIIVFPYTALKAVINSKNNDHLEWCTVRRSYGFLYNEYKMSKYYWEIIKLLQKAILIIIINYLDGQTITQGTLISCVLLTYIILT